MFKDLVEDKKIILRARNSTQNRKANKQIFLPFFLSFSTSLGGFSALVCSGCFFTEGFLIERKGGKPDDVFVRAAMENIKTSSIMLKRIHNYGLSA